ncbi:DNA topology modulation protein [Clostridium sp. 1001271B_151109_B4]|uniref:DNA topology modulation protein n=1 Tax=Clostridium sp. 1001271B_151109_B4 TaxID=2787148 RepID=UPI0018AA3FBE|nr:DNA topology modulation protein [Clostridium sp. 1001271B_151109_B4]
MEKIIVVGCGGAGKSTFSRELSNKLDIPVYHLDKLFWNEGWIETPKAEFNKKIEKVINKDKWIIDGNYIRTIDIRAKKADTIIFINMPTYICLYRIFKRRFMYRGKSRPDMAEGCPEGIDIEFFKWVLSYNKKIRPEILKKLSLYKEKDIIILNGKKEVRKFLEG